MKITIPGWPERSVSNPLHEQESFTEASPPRLLQDGDGRPLSNEEVSDSSLEQ